MVVLDVFVYSFVFVFEKREVEGKGDMKFKLKKKLTSLIPQVGWVAGNVLRGRLLPMDSFSDTDLLYRSFLALVALGERFIYFAGLEMTVAVSVS